MGHPPLPSTYIHALPEMGSFNLSTTYTITHIQTTYRGVVTDSLTIKLLLACLGGTSLVECNNKSEVQAEYLFRSTS